VYCQAAKSDGGWTLEMDDLRSVLEDAFGIDVKEDTEMLQRLFSTMDVNGDGVVTQDEWVSDSVRAHIRLCDLRTDSLGSANYTLCVLTMPRADRHASCRRSTRYSRLSSR
jgi:hypothetical protein